MDFHFPIRAMLNKDRSIREDHADTTRQIVRVDAGDHIACIRLRFPKREDTGRMGRSKSAEPAG